MEQALCLWLENNPTVRNLAEHWAAKYVVAFLKRLATKNPWTLDILQGLSLLIMVWGALPANLVAAHLAEPAWLAQYENMSTATIAFVTVNILAQIPNATYAKSPVIFPVQTNVVVAEEQPISGKEKAAQSQP